MTVVVATVFTYGFSKTAMPVAGVVASPVLAAALGPTVAAGFIIPLLLLGDLMGLLYYRQHANWSLLVRIVPGVLVGFVVSAVLFWWGSPALVARVIGILLLTSIVLEVVRRRARRRSPASDDELAVGDGDTKRSQVATRDRWEAAAYGVLTGTTTMAANAGGTAMSLYLIKMRVPMLTFMGTSVWFFFILNFLKLPILLPLGLITGESLLADLWFAPVLVLGGILGVVVFRRMNQEIGRAHV